MGQKVNPNGFRLGVVKKHNANWYAKGKAFSKFGSRLKS
jgi:small subunit ribosomal protein S3